MRTHNVVLVITVALSIALMFACGKKDKDDKDKTKDPDKANKVNAADPTPDDTKKADGQKPDTGKQTDDTPDVLPEAAQCQRILDKAWSAIQPVLAKVDVDPAALEKNYKSNKQFVERCSRLMPRDRECLEKSDNPVLAIHTCKVNTSDMNPNEKIWAPSVSPRSDWPMLGEEESKAQLARMVGTWVSNWESFGQVTTWKITATGDFEETKVKDGESDKKSLYLSFDSVRRVKIRTTATSTQTYAFLMVDDKTFLASSNQAYDAYPVADKNNFVLWTRSEWLFNENGKCSVISDRGEEMEAKCEWMKTGKPQVLQFTYNEPGRFKRDGTPIDSQKTYRYMGNHMVDHRMVDMALFKKK